MDVDMLREFFFWCTVINAILLIVASGTIKIAGGWIYETQGKWFSVPEEAFSVVIYSLIGGYKVLIIVFNAVPWIVLSVIG